MIKDRIIESLVSIAYMKRIPLICTIEITTACSFRCVHCYVTEKDVPIYLDVRKVIQFIDDITNMGCLYIVLTGGDPFLHPNFWDIYTYARKRCNVTIFTNGYSISENDIMKLSQNPPSLMEITLYGSSDETYQKVVGIRAFSKVIKNVITLQENNVRIKLKCFLVKENVNDFDTIKRIAQVNHMPFKYDSFIISKVDTFQYSHQLDIDGQKLINKSKLDGLMIGENLKELIEHKSWDNLYKCGAGKYSVWLKSDYTLNMCAFSSEDKSVSLSDFTLLDAWNKIGNESESIIPHTIRCYKCKKRDSCVACPTKYIAVMGIECINEAVFCKIEINGSDKNAICE